MNIDWLTTIAQIINFLILVWLLKRFLYKPILKAIDERDRKITVSMEEAKTKKEEALKEKETYSAKIDEIQQKKDELMTQAISEAKKHETKLMEETRINVQDFQKKLQSSIQKMEVELKNEVSDKIQREVVEIAKKVLKDLSTGNLQDQIFSMFLKKIERLGGNEKAEFQKAFNVNNSSLAINSAFELNSDQKNLIASSLKKIIEEDLEITYNTTPKLICGLELYANGYKLGWNLSEYLSVIQSEVLNASYHEN